MDNAQLQIIIDQLNEVPSKGNATFGIHRFERGPGDHFIKANKDGLILFAIELLNAAKNGGSVTGNNLAAAIDISADEEWIDEKSDTIIKYIELVAYRKSKPKSINQNTNVADKLVPAGCLLLVIILVVSLVVGLWTLVKWIF